MKKILSGSEARKALIEGMKYLAEPVAATLGPQGRNAVIGIGWGQIPKTTRDGVTVAKSIDHPDPVLDQGVQLLKHVSSRTAEVSGDGTTTATVLAYSMCKAGVEAVENGANPAQLKTEILEAAQQVSERLGKMSVPVHGKRIEQVATIAANNDEELGRVISMAIRKAGSHGVVTVEDSSNLETTVESSEGMRLSSGWASPYFVNNQQKMEFYAEDCRVLIFERRLGNLTSGMQEALQAIAQSREPLVIMAESIEGDMLSVMVANRVGNQKLGAPPMPWCAVRIPQGTSRDALHDIAAAVGGRAITEDQGIALDSNPVQFAGRVKSIRVTKFGTTIVSEGRTAEIEERIAGIQVQLASTDDPIERDRFQERLAKLSGGIARILVGAATEVELKEKKARIEDAIHATKAAIEEGIVPGGGFALFSLMAMPVYVGVGSGSSWDKFDTGRKSTPGAVIPYQKAPNTEFLQDHGNPGQKIVCDALCEPLRRIVENAGESFDNVWVKMGPSMKNGFNALTGEYGDLIEMGVVDPLKVTRTALMNAASLAAMVILTENLIISIEEPNGQ